MCKLTTLLIVFYLRNTCSALTDQNVCTLDSEQISKPLQVAFALDRTYGGVVPNVHTFQEVKFVKSAMTAINRTFPGTEFALTLFADYPDALDPRTITNPDDCYTRLVKFTRDQAALNKGLDGFKLVHNSNLRSGDKEATFVGVMMTAADLAIQWDADKRVRKVIVFVTNADISYPKKPGNLQPPKGDGTDTCATTLPPDYQMLQKVLNSKSIIAIGGLIPDTIKDIVDRYQKHFDPIYTPYKGFLVPPYHASNVAAKTAEVSEDVVKYISTQVRSCIYSDPPAYNTLGL